MSEFSFENARAIANEIRAVWPEKAAEIDAAIDAAESARKDGLQVTGSIRLRLEKFDGDYQPGMQPVEVIETEESLV